MSEPGTADVDVAVVGGGPAGSTVANLLAQQGWRVRLFERERFPRYQIGESLQAGTHFLWNALGVRERLAAAGFVIKKGATYRWGQNAEPWSVTFAEEGFFPTAFQVERNKFDKIMLDRAAEVGADVREAHTVLGALVEDGRCVGLRVRDAAGVESVTRARYVVDASGQQRCLDDLLPPRQLNKKLGRAALWTYFEDAGRLPGEREGNLFIATMPEGWCWLIPLSGGRTSVGCVLGTDFKGRGAHGDSEGQAADLQELFDSLLDKCPQIRELVRQGRQVEPVRSLANWSYRRDRTTAPGMIAAGDAARFVDPILSAGVFLATVTGYVAAIAINTALHDPGAEDEAWSFYEDWTARAADTHQSMAEYWYDAEGVEDDYFWHSRRLVDPAGHMTARRAFVFATSGYVGNLAATAERGRIDAENFRHLGVRAPERFVDVDVQQTHRDQDQTIQMGAVASTADSASPVRLTPADNASGPVQYIHRFRLFSLPADLPIPGADAADCVLLAQDVAQPDRASFIELNRAPARAYRTLGQVAFGYRTAPGDAERVGLRQLEALLGLLSRAPGTVVETPEVAATWLARHASEAGLSVSLWSVRG